MAIGEGLEHLRDLARPMTALYVGGMGARGRNFYNALARRYGFEAEAELIQDLYLEREEGGSRRRGPRPSSSKRRRSSARPVT